MVTFSKSARHIFELRNLLRNGVVVAAPTETAYGLLADATSPVAVARICKLKGRAKAKPIHVLVASLADARRYVRFSPFALKLARRFWPGALTLVLPARQKFPAGICAPDGTLGVRVPGNSWLRQLVRCCGFPITATSANQGGKPTLYSSNKVARTLGPRGLRYVVRGTLRPRPTSTVVLVRGKRFSLLREGAIPSSKLKRVVG